MRVFVSFSDRAVSDFIRGVERLGVQGPRLLADALNAEGAAARKQTVAAEIKQTGLPEKTIDRAQQVSEAGVGRLQFRITARGGNVRLKFFGPSEGGGGVTATPWGRAAFFAGAFLTSGPNGRRRLSPRLGGQVFENVQGGKWGGKIRVVRSGLFIPDEMVKGATEAAFDAAMAEAAPRIVDRLGRLLP